MKANAHETGLMSYVGAILLKEEFATKAGRRGASSFRFIDPRGLPFAPRLDIVTDQRYDESGHRARESRTLIA
jgi:hypothetical protein